MFGNKCRSPIFLHDSIADFVTLTRSTILDWPRDMLGVNRFNKREDEHSWVWSFRIFSVMEERELANVALGSEIDPSKSDIETYSLY